MVSARSAPPRLHAARNLSEKPDISIPQARRIAVDTRGAQIVQEESPAVSRVAVTVTDDGNFHTARINIIQVS